MIKEEYRVQPFRFQLPGSHMAFPPREDLHGLSYQCGDKFFIEERLVPRRHITVFMHRIVEFYRSPD